MKVNTPLVSITSAIYNTGPRLLDMVKSIFAQTFTDWELILLDDGSTDDSHEIIQSISSPRVRAFTNGQNLGRSVSLNRITTLARGKYIARMDSDDMSGANRLRKQIELMELNPDIDVVGTGVCYLDKFDKPMGHQYALPLHSEICRNPSRTIGLCHGSILGKKTWFEEHRYDESIPFAIDFNLFLHSFDRSKFANVPEPLYYYRLDQSFNLRKQFIDRYISARFLFRYHKNAGRTGQAFLHWCIQYVKFAVTALMFSAGFRRKLIAKRFEKISEADMMFYEQEIYKIKNMELPH